MKWRLFFFLAALITIGPPAFAADPASEPHYRNVALAEVKLLTASPDKEGRLSAAQWAEVPISGDFYVYWDSDPDFSPLQSGLQAAYDRNAVYLRLTAREEAMDRIRAAIVKRGNPSLWTDDCFEVYIDPLARGISYLVFTVNSLGTQNDRKQMDAAVSLPEWRGEGWRAWASREKDRWIVEITFPFSDLEATAQEGDLWMFNLVRYAYTSGRFQGASWAPGGTYATPGNFGYLYFGGSQPVETKTLAAKLGRIIIAPWSVTYHGKLIRSSGGAPPKIVDIPDAAADLLARYQALASSALEIAAGSEGDRARIAELAAKAPDFRTHTEQEAFATLRGLKSLYAELFALYWKQRTEALADQISAPR